MPKYGQFCPIAKSAEILGDPWSILIVRELLLGSTQFSVLEKGLPRISPTVLNTRLKELEERGVIREAPLEWATRARIPPDPGRPGIVRGDRGACGLGYALGAGRNGA